MFILPVFPGPCRYNHFHLQGDLSKGRCGQHPRRIAVAAILQPTTRELVPPGLLDVPDVKRSPKIYREAKEEDIDAIFGLYQHENLISPTCSQLRDWIRKREFFLATYSHGSDIPIGMVRVAHAWSLKEREILISQFCLTQSIKVIHDAAYDDKGKIICEHVENIGSERSLDVDCIEFVYGGSFSVIEPERGSATAFRLLNYGLSRTQPKQFFNLPDSAPLSRKIYGLIFGTAKNDSIVLPLATRCWLKALKSTGHTASEVSCLVFDHVRPDGKKAQGNLLLFEPRL